ncbi:hypothetical protein AB0F91_33135 [Amycolatopsis sp. NPDC023774]|uniref:hypothetical protein n=1 Tax=Amycolatopsis sp. NPDC023774 TaxID=3155015 RepID=UPI0034019270
MRLLNRLLTAALASAAAGGLAVIPSAASTPTPLTSMASPAAHGMKSCQITLPGGIPVTVTDTGGQVSTQLVGRAADNGVLSFDSGGHEVILPMSVMRNPAGVDLAAYDTTLLAQRTCGYSPPAAARPNPAPDYQLARLTLRPLDRDGRPATGWVVLANVDATGSARVAVWTDGPQGGSIAVPEGHYAALFVDSDYSDPKNKNVSFVVDPDFTVTDGTIRTLDARTATEKIPTPATPRPAILQSTAVNFARGYGDGDGPGYADWANFLDLGSDPVNMKINPVGRVAHGNLTVNPAFEFSAPAGSPEAYSYHITEPFDHVPAAFPTTVDPATLATVERGYGAPGTPGLAVTATSGEPAWEARTRFFAVRGVDMVQTGARQTEYFSTGPDLVWMTILDDPGWADQLVTSRTTYLPGSHQSEDFHTGAQHPSVPLESAGTPVACGACSNDNSLLLNIVPLGDNTPGHAADSAAVAAPDSQTYTTSLTRNGQLLATGEVSPTAIDIAVPRGSATYQLRTTNRRSIAALPLSTTAQTTWTFTANPGHGGRLPAGWMCSDATTNCTTMPLLFANYTADADLLNQLPPGQHNITLTVTDQQHWIAPTVAGASVSVSYDDGKSWQPLPVTGGAGSFHAPVTVPADTKGGYLSLRISAWDRAGNRIDQTVTRAYGVR